ncbi:MAG: hypothetical protein IBJ00_07315 [Alphaproteobacteria bacterium]|nr:hypothetical protein [Alphaproteobacteria bacterium]
MMKKILYSTVLTSTLGFLTNYVPSYAKLTHIAEQNIKGKEEVSIMTTPDICPVLTLDDDIFSELPPRVRNIYLEKNETIDQFQQRLLEEATYITQNLYQDERGNKFKSVGFASGIYAYEDIYKASQEKDVKDILREHGMTRFPAHVGQSMADNKGQCDYVVSKEKVGLFLFSLKPVKFIDNNEPVLISKEKKD